MKRLIFVIAFLLVSISVSAQVAQRFVLTWVDQSDNELGFNIYRDGVKVAAVAADIKTYTDTVTGQVGQSVCYEVSAFNNSMTDGTGTVQESAKTPKQCGTIAPIGSPDSPGTLAIVLSEAPAAQSPLTINWTAPTKPKPTPKDWVALYRAKDPDKTHISGNVCAGKPCWVYTNGAAKGTFVVTPPATDPLGTAYDVRYMLNDGFKSAMKSRGSWTPQP